MKNALMALAVFLVACIEPPPVEDAYEYAVTGSGLVTADYPLQRTALLRNFALARSIIVDSGMVTESELDIMMSQVTVHVRTDSSWTIQKDGQPLVVIGQYHTDTKVIELSLHGESLLHEWFHVWDISRGIEHTENHPRWLERGLYKLNDRFRDNFCWLDAPNCDPIRQPPLQCTPTDGIEPDAC